MDAVSSSQTAAAYATASQGMVFSSVALSFVGLGWALALMLRPKTSSLCLWSMALFSLAWLIESTTHLLGVGGHAGTESLKYGVWVAVGLFGAGFIVGVLGVLAYMRNEHRYERGLLVGVVATLANLWVVGGIFMALRHNRTAVLGRGLVIPVMSSGGPVDAQALAEHLNKLPGRQASDTSLKMAGMLGRAVSDLAIALSGGKGSAWEMKQGTEGEGPASALAGHPSGSPEVLRALHPNAQHVLTLSTEPGWMSLGLEEAPADADAAAVLAARALKALEAQTLALTPTRRLRAVRTNLAGFEIVRTTTQATVRGLAGPVCFDQWVAVADGHAVEVLACAPQETAVFLDATNDMVNGVLRKLQRDGLAGPVPSEEIQSQRGHAAQLERRDQFAEALAVWRQAALTTPADAESFLGVLRCSWKVGKSKDAVAWLESGTEPTPPTVSTAVGALRLRAATGQAEAREELLKRFDSGLADDDALAGLMVSFAARQDRAGALKALAALGPRHGEKQVAWWKTYLSSPPTPPSAGTPASAASAPAPNASPKVGTTESGKTTRRPTASSRARPRPAR